MAAFFRRWQIVSQNRILFASSFTMIAGISGTAFGSGGIVNWYDELFKLVSGERYSEYEAERFIVIAGGLFVLGVCSFLGFFYQKALQRSRNDDAPDGRFSLKTLMEMTMDLVVGIAKDSLGSNWRTYAPLLAGLFMFILVSNLGGLIPGFAPPTESLSNNLAMGLTVFLVYNIAGFREHGSHYLKQFTGPMMAIAPLMLVIELIGHVFRPVSLSLRLMGNIFADHLLLKVFTETSHFIVPSALMFFGLLVALIQSFVFTLLSSVYISMAVSHDH